MKYKRCWNIYELRIYCSYAENVKLAHLLERDVLQGAEGASRGRREEREGRTCLPACHSPVPHEVHFEDEQRAEAVVALVVLVSLALLLGGGGREGREKRVDRGREGEKVLKKPLKLAGRGAGEES